MSILHATAVVYTSIKDTTKGTSWVTSFTQSATSDVVNTSKGNGSALSDLVAYALPAAVQSKIMDATGVALTSAVNRGIVIVIVQSGSYNGLMPSSGVSVSTSVENGAAQFFYFDDNFTTYQTTPQTNSSGIFVVMGSSGNVSTVNVPMTLSGGSGGDAWAPATFEIGPGSVVVAGWVAE